MASMQGGREFQITRRGPQSYSFLWASKATIAPHKYPGVLATRPNTPGSWGGVGRLMWLGSPT